MAIPSSGSPTENEWELQVLRAAGTGGRAKLALYLSDLAIRKARAAIRHRHPEYSEQEVRLEFVAVHYGADLAERVRRYLEQRRR